MRNNRSSSHNRTGTFFRHNRQIRISPVRLIDQNDEMVGVVPTDQAMRMAQDAGLDLVEVAPNVRPPVCKILDYGKWKYQQQKKEDKQRAAQRHSTLKEVKIRTTKIDQHDLMIKVKHAKEFLQEGHKVQFTLQYRGREMAHQELGLEIMNKVKRELFMFGKVEQDFRMMGKRGTMVLAPDRKDPNKIKPPAPGERITVGTKGIRLDQDVAPESSAAPAAAAS
jgi:translation initiation factor IF-3